MQSSEISPEKAIDGQLVVEEPQKMDDDTENEQESARTEEHVAKSSEGEVETRDSQSSQSETIADKSESIEEEPKSSSEIEQKQDKNNKEASDAVVGMEISKKSDDETKEGAAKVIGEGEETHRATEIEIPTFAVSMNPAITSKQNKQLDPHHDEKERRKLASLIRRVYQLSESEVNTRKSETMAKEQTIALRQEIGTLSSKLAAQSEQHASETWNLNATVEELERKNKTLSEQVDEEKSRLQIEIRRASTRLEEKIKIIEDQKVKEYQLETQLRETSGELETIKSKIAEVESLATTFDRHFDEITIEKEATLKQLNDTRATAEVLSQTVSDLKTAFDDQKKKRNDETSEISRFKLENELLIEKVELLRRDLEEASSCISLLKKSLKHHEDLHSTEMAARSRAEAQTAHVRSSLRQNQDIAQAANERMATIQKSLDAMKNELSQKNQMIEELETELEDLRKFKVDTEGLLKQIEIVDDAVDENENEMPTMTTHTYSPQSTSTSKRQRVEAPKPNEVEETLHMHAAATAATATIADDEILTLKAKHIATKPKPKPRRGRGGKATKV